MSVVSTLAVALALSPVGQLQDAPDRLITKHGVELVSDGRVFVLFAALNALGFSEESQSKGPPLRSPEFHPIRADVVNAMRKLGEKEPAKLAALKQLFEANPAEIETYLAAILSYEETLTKVEGEMPAAAKALKSVDKTLAALGTDPELTKIFDEVAASARNHSKELMARIDRDLTYAETYLAQKGLRAPKRLIVISNPLDSHGAVRQVELWKTTALVVGPGFDSAARAVVAAVIKPQVKASVDKAYANLGPVKKAWDGVKGTKRITERFGDGAAYTAETLARAIAFQIHAKQTPATPEQIEEYADQQSKDGLRWMRPMLRALEGQKEGETVEVATPKILGRVGL